MSAFVDGLRVHNLASADVQVRIYPLHKESEQIQINAGDETCIMLSIDQARELALVLVAAGNAILRGADER